jgi:ribA/ribD-fused uncharacterized protein
MYKIPENIKVTIRGKTAYDYYIIGIIKQQNDIDIQVSTEKEYEILKQFFSSNYDFQEEQFYNIKNIPRKRFKGVINGENIILDVLISNNYYLERKLVMENYYMPEISELLSEFLIAVSNTQLGIKNDNSEYYNEKIQSLFKRISKLSEFKFDNGIISSLNHHIKNQNSFYDSNITLADVVVSIFFSLHMIKNDSDRINVKNLLIEIAKLNFNTNELDKIDFFDANLRFGCFSNFSQHKVSYQNEIWPTSEHCYQAQKFLSKEFRSNILNSETPKIAARLGRSLEPVRPHWILIKPIIMYEIIYAKTVQNSDVLFCLLSTVGKNIFEINERDDYWGLGKSGQGINMLGIIIMTIRNQLII